MSSISVDLACDDKKIFTYEEKEAIKEKRLNFENELWMIKPPIAIYYSFIEFEKSVSRLMQIRSEKSGVESIATQVENYKRRIIAIFERLVFKHKENVSVWIDYILFLKEEGFNKAVSDIFAEVLSIHPTKPRLWVMASFWQFDAQKDVESARKLLQKALNIFKIEESETNNKSKISSEFSIDFAKTMAKFSADKKLEKVQDVPFFDDSEKHILVDKKGDFDLNHSELLWASLFTLELKNLRLKASEIDSTELIDDLIKIPFYVLCKAKSWFKSGEMFRKVYRFLIEETAFDSKEIESKLIFLLEENF